MKRERAQTNSGNQITSDYDYGKNEIIKAERKVKSWSVTNKLGVASSSTVEQEIKIDWITSSPPRSKVKNQWGNVSPHDSSQIGQLTRVLE